MRPRKLLLALSVSVGILAGLLVAPNAAMADPPWVYQADKITKIARGELGTAGTGSEGNCVKYGPGCVAWCSYFATWVWDKAGLGPGGRNPTYASSAEFYQWGQRKGYSYGKNIKKHVRRGDALFFGTGPSNTDTSKHVGIVEKVHSKGVTLIEGNRYKDGKWKVIRQYRTWGTTWRKGFYGGVHPSAAYPN